MAEKLTRRGFLKAIALLSTSATLGALAISEPKSKPPVWYEAHVAAIFGDAMGYKLASKTLRHYLSAQGTELDVKPEFVEALTKYLNEQNNHMTVEKYFEQEIYRNNRANLRFKHDGRVGRLSTSISANKAEIPDIYYGIGEYHITVSGLIEDKSPHIFAIYPDHITITDRYRWRTGWTGIQMGNHEIGIDWQDLDELRVQGYAKEYNLYAELTDFNESIKIDIG